MLKRISGKAQVEWKSKTASTPMINGNPVISTSGYLVNGTATTTAFVGVILRDVISTDADYAFASATETKVPVDIGLADCIFEADVKPGVTPTLAEVNTMCDCFVGTGSTGTLYEIYIDPGTNTHHQFEIVGYISSTKILVRFNQAATLRGQAVA